MIKLCSATSGTELAPVFSSNVTTILTATPFVTVAVLLLPRCWKDHTHRALELPGRWAHNVAALQRQLEHNNLV